MGLHFKTLADGTRVTVEDNDCAMVQVRVSKGKVHRCLPLTRDEAEALREVLFRLPKPELLDDGVHVRGEVRRRPLDDRVPRSLFNGEVELPGQPDSPDQAQRIAIERRWSEDPETPSLQIIQPTRWIDDDRCGVGA